MPIIKEPYETNAEQCRISGEVFCESKITIWNDQPNQVHPDNTIRVRTATGTFNESVQSTLRVNTRGKWVTVEASVSTLAETIGCTFEIVASQERTRKLSCGEDSQRNKANAIWDPTYTDVDALINCDD
ncbi:MAG: hypothetical protein AAF363_01865 [Bacteroidota bacterium]